jgi:hypothetical protein
MIFDIYNIVGLIGMAMTVLAYFLMSFNIIPSGGAYQIMNGVGSAFLIYSLVVHQNIPAMIMEIVWFAISISSLARSLLRK